MTKKQAMELELARLREENESLRLKEEARIENPNNQFFDELKKIQKAGEKTQGNIQYKDIHHPTVALWRKDGKMIGPLHPANAELTFRRFYDIGILLFTRKPTQKEIEAYKQSAEYKKIELAEKKKRQLRDKSKKKDNIQELAKVLQDSFGVKGEELNSIKAREEVGV